MIWGLIFSCDKLSLQKDQTIQFNLFKSLKQEIGLMGIAASGGLPSHSWSVAQGYTIGQRTGFYIDGGHHLMPMGVQSLAVGTPSLRFG